MFNLCSLSSGSSGNCILLQTTNSNFLIDIGISTKKIEENLKELELSPNQIDGILITHEHEDHVRGIKTFSKKYNTNIFVESNVKHCLEKYLDTSKDNIKTFNTNEKFEINDLKIHPFSIPHDATNPVAFTFFHDNVFASIATDIGHITNTILKNLEDSSFALLEANYDENVLMMSRYPYPLKQRIKGNLGHLENKMSGKTIAYLSQGNLKGALLGHLSLNSNMPDLAKMTVENEVKNSNNSNKNVKVDVAPRSSRSEIYNLYDYV